MKVQAPRSSQKEMAQIRQRLNGSAAIDKAAQLIHLAGSPTRLKIIYLLRQIKELSIGELAKTLGVSLSGVSQHLAKLRGAGLVTMRRDRQTIFARLTVHPFNASLCEEFLPPFAPRGVAADPGSSSRRGARLAAARRQARRA